MGESVDWKLRDTCRSVCTASRLFLLLRLSMLVLATDLLLRMISRRMISREGSATDAGLPDFSRHI
jgi:hypothetical protein